MIAAKRTKRVGKLSSSTSVVDQVSVTIFHVYIVSVCVCMFGWMDGSTEGYSENFLLSKYLKLI